MSDGLSVCPTWCRDPPGTSVFSVFINPLNAELNPICHLLILLGDLTFMGPRIVSISNKMQRYTVYLYLETALHVSGGTCKARPDSTQACALDTHTNRGHTTTYQYRKMTKPAVEAW
jgi:hypothetical protein